MNPDHLEPVTHLENQRRSPLTIAGRNIAKTHCAQGHDLSPGDGRRICKQCRAQASRRHYLAKRVAA